MGQSSHDELDLVITTMAKTIVDNADYFAQLDSIAGDGDFGYSLRNGWEVILADYDGWDLPTTGAVLKKVGATLAAKVGGVSGPMWGTAFLRAGATAGDKEEIAPEDVIEMLRAAIAGIMARGGAPLGDKTLLDALAPVTDSLEASIADPATARGPRDRRDPAGRRRGRQGGRGHHGHARAARPRRVHGRAEPGFGGCRRHRDRGHPPGHRRRLARGLWERTGGRFVKKFVNDPRQFVPEFLEGVQLASGGSLKYEPKYNLIYRADMPKADRVSIIQGSGSGHEPAHTMIVGPGMLDAACPGDVFAGPPVEFVTETSKLMDTPAGVLYIVNNYTGDRSAWEMARELCEAEGQKIGYLLVNDDVAVKDSTWTVGRRGVAGNFFVIKAAAAVADQGGSLEECVRGRREGDRQRAHDGRRALVVHAARPRHPAVRHRRRRDGGRHRHPRRAGPRAHEDRRARTRSSTCCSTRSCRTCRSRPATRSR